MAAPEQGLLRICFRALVFLYPDRVRFRSCARGRPGRRGDRRASAGRLEKDRIDRQNRIAGETPLRRSRAPPAAPPAVSCPSSRPPGRREHTLRRRERGRGARPDGGSSPIPGEDGGSPARRPGPGCTSRGLSLFRRRRDGGRAARGQHFIFDPEVYRAGGPRPGGEGRPAVTAAGRGYLRRG